MTRWILGSVVVVLGLASSIFLLQIVASETGEVVVLQTQDGGTGHETRLWVVDVDGHQYLRAGGAGSKWFARLSAEPEVTVLRGGVEAPYLAAPAAEQRSAVNGAMRAKYGWRDSVIDLLVGGRDDAIPVRLDPR